MATAKDKRPMTKLRTARKAAGLTQGVLAYMCGIRTDAVQAYEAGERVPNAATFSRLARAVGKTTVDIDEWEKEPLNTI